MPRKFKGRLPALTKPWELIRLAVQDLKAAEKDPGCVIDMGNWHGHAWLTPSRKPCPMCLAGAVMRGTGGVPNTVRVTPDNFEKNIKRKLNALDAFRLGSVNTAYGYLGLAPIESPAYGTIRKQAGLRRVWEPEQAYEENPAEFKRRLLRLATALKRYHRTHPVRKLRKKPRKTFA